MTEATHEPTTHGGVTTHGGITKRVRATKRKVSVSLDEDLVTELDAGDEALSTQVNEAVRNELERRRRHRLLDELLEQYERDAGPVDETLVAKYLDLLA